jgi:hypothetical protein
MRKLTLKRKKTLISSMVKIRIFIEHSAGEFELDKIKCTEIGSLKNGETGQYEIPTGDVNLLVLYSKIFPNKNYTPYKIPAGSDDLELFTYPWKIYARNPFVVNTKEELVTNGETDGW